MYAGFLLYSHIYARSTTAFQMEQSLSVRRLAMCSVGVCPVAANDPTLVAVYAMPTGPAQPVSTVVISMSRIRISFMILHDLTPRVNRKRRGSYCEVVTSGSRVLDYTYSYKIFPLPLCGQSINWLLKISNSG